MSTVITYHVLDDESLEQVTEKEALAIERERITWKPAALEDALLGFDHNDNWLYLATSSKDTLKKFLIRRVK